MLLDTIGSSIIEHYVLLDTMGSSIIGHYRE